MQDTFKEHTLKFVIGQNDINSDADWEAYLAALEKAGPAEYGRVYQAAWNRAPFFLTRTAGIGATEPLQPSRTDPGASRARHGLIDAGSPCGLAGSEPLRFGPGLSQPATIRTALAACLLSTKSLPRSVITMYGSGPSLATETVRNCVTAESACAGLPCPGSRAGNMDGVTGGGRLLAALADGDVRLQIYARCHVHEPIDAEFADLSVNELAHPRTRDPEASRGFCLGNVLALHVIGKSNHEPGTDLKVGGLRQGLCNCIPYIRIGLRVLHKNKPFRIGTLRKLRATIAILSDLSYHLPKTLPSDIYIGLCRLLRLLHEHMQDINRIAECRRVHAPIRITSYPYAKLTNAAPDSRHRPPVAWIHTALNHCNLLSHVMFRIRRETPEIVERRSNEHNLFHFYEAQCLAFATCKSSQPVLFRERERTLHRLLATIRRPTLQPHLDIAVPRPDGSELVRAVRAVLSRPPS